MNVDDLPMLTAIASVRDAYRRDREQDRDAQLARVDAIRVVAQRVTSSFAEEREGLDRRIAARLLPVDPLHQTWNVFRLFDVAYEETRWTQWLAAILRPGNGRRCSAVAWRAFCDAAARRARAQPPLGPDALCDADHWRHVAGEVPTVEDEVSDGPLGRLDLLITTPSVLVAVENKLWAGWHDGANAPQADRYRDLAKKRLASDAHRKLGLVLLSERAGLTVATEYLLHHDELEAAAARGHRVASHKREDATGMMDIEIAKRWEG